jgi:hypothetical protein
VLQHLLVDALDVAVAGHELLVEEGQLGLLVELGQFD